MLSHFGLIKLNKIADQTKPMQSFVDDEYVNATSLKTVLSIWAVSFYYFSFITDKNCGKRAMLLGVDTQQKFPVATLPS